MKVIITEKQLRQIVSESFKRYLLNEGIEHPETIFIYDLTIDRVHILDGQNGIYRFVAKVNQQTNCEWETQTVNGYTVVTDGTIEGTVDLTQIRSAIGKNQSIQRQIITKFFQQVFGFFNVSGTIQTLNNTDLILDQTTDLQVEMEEETDIITVNKVVLKTEGLTEEGEDEFDDFEEQEPEVEPTDAEAEGNEFIQQLRKAGFTLEQDGDKGKIRTISGNQWVATYYSNNSVMTFPDVKDEALIGNLKTACANAGVRFLEQ